MCLGHYNDRLGIIMNTPPIGEHNQNFVHLHLLATQCNGAVFPGASSLTATWLLLTFVLTSLEFFAFATWKGG